MNLPDPTKLPISPNDALSVEDETRMLMETFGLPEKKLKMPAPRKQSANLKTPRPRSTGSASVFGDLLVPPPVNPRFVWKAVAIEFHVAVTTCQCKRSYSTPMPAMCVWERPHGNQRVTNRRFPRDYQGLPSSTIVHEEQRINGCHECLTVTPTEFGESPLGDDPAPLAVPTPLTIDPTELDEIKDLL